MVFFLFKMPFFSHISHAKNLERKAKTSIVSSKSDIYEYLLPISRLCEVFFKNKNATYRNRILFRFVVVLLLIFGCQPNYSQTMRVEIKQYNDENGLSRFANYIHKDSRGIIWIGTQYGLYRFDGQEFTHFNEKDGLPFRQVMEIYEDSEGWFWLYRSCLRKPNCKKDVAFFHPLTREIMTFEQRFGKDLGFQVSAITGIAQDSTKIYFTANKKFISWSAEQGIQVVPIQGLSSNPILWTKVKEGIFGAYIFSGNAADHVFLSNNIQVLVFDNEGNLRQSPKPIDIEGFSYENFNRMRRKAFEFDRIRVRNYEWSFAIDHALVVDSLTNEYPCCPTTLQYYHADEQLCIDGNLEYHHPQLGKIADPMVVYEEQDNKQVVNLEMIQTIWIRKKGSTVFEQFNTGSKGARHVFFDVDTKMAWLAGPTGVSTYLYKPQRIWHALNENESQLAYSTFDLGDGKILLRAGTDFILYKHDSKEVATYLDLGSKINSQVPRTFSFENSGSTLFGLSHAHLFKIDPQDFSYSKLVLPKRMIDPRILLKMDNLLWLCGKKGIYWFDLVEERLVAFDQYNEFEDLKASKIHFIEEGEEGQFWICSNTGLYLYSIEEGVIARYGNTQKGSYFLPASNFFHLSKAKFGGFWLATMNGLIYWQGLSTKTNSFLKLQNCDSRSFCQFSIDNGLSNNEIFAAYEDDFGFVWMPTPHGLIQFQIDSGLSKTYLKSDGLSDSGFQEYVHLQLADGTFYFGGYNGFNILDPKDFKDVDLSPHAPLNIVDFEQYIDQTNQIEYQLADILRKGAIILKPGDKFFNIRVAFKDYRAAEKHRFAYKINGYQKEWQEGRSNLIRISGLPYGNFTLKIRGCLQDGLLAKPVLEIPIQVLKPFYLQPWLLSISFCFFILAIGLFFQGRTRRLEKGQKKLEASITEATETIRKQNEELKNLDKVKSRFFANVSHELRTPVTLILGPLTSMIKSGTLNQRNATFADLGLKNAKSLLNLVNEILELNKMESGKQELHTEVILFYPIAHRIVDAFEGIARQKDIDYSFHYKADQELCLELDVKKVEKLVNNLLSNAFKFTPPGGKINVTIKDQQDSIQIRIKDTGRGIHQNDLPNIFERYYQSSRPDALKEGGTGIGLSLCMEFSKLMGGQLWAESTLGKGSTFYFKFPKKEVHSSTKEVKKEMYTLQQKEAPQFEASLLTLPETIPSNTKILLVEDNDNLREYIQLIISDKYKVFSAENGRVAWELLTLGDKDSENPKLCPHLPDLIISDIMMPEMDGYQLLEKLKGNDQLRGIPIIMLTALAELKDKLKALRIGVDDYMTKPFEEEELKARIDNLLLNYYRKRQYRQEVQKEKEPNNEGPNEENKYTKAAYSREDNLWLENLEQAILNKLGNFDFSVEQLAQDLASSRWSLYRRIKHLTGLTATQYLQEVRLNHARQLLENQIPNSVKSLSYDVGIKDVKYFSRQFKKRFGKPPSDYL